MRYALQPRYRRYVRGYGFLSFAKNLAKRGLVSTAVRAAAKKATDAGKKLATREYPPPETLLNLKL